MTREDELLGILAAESQAECQSIISDATSRAEDVIERARTRAAELREERLKEIRKKVDAEMAKAASSARLEGNKVILRAKHSLIAEAFRKAREELSRVRATGEYESILEGLIVETVPQKRREAGSMMADPKDADLSTRILSRLGMKIRVSPTLSCLGGIRFQSESHAVSVDNTFESRLTRAREDLMVRAASVLFGSEHGV